jgi:hypothetical protein
MTSRQRFEERALFAVALLFIFAPFIMLAIIGGLHVRDQGEVWYDACSTIVANYSPR